MAIDNVTNDTHNLYNPYLWYKKQYTTESIFMARLLTGVKSITAAERTIILLTLQCSIRHQNIMSIWYCQCYPLCNMITPTVNPERLPVVDCISNVMAHSDTREGK